MRIFDGAYGVCVRQIDYVTHIRRNSFETGSCSIYEGRTSKAILKT